MLDSVIGIKLFNEELRYKSVLVVVSRKAAIVTLGVVISVEVGTIDIRGFVVVARCEIVTLGVAISVEVGTIELGFVVVYPCELILQLPSTC